MSDPGAERGGDLRCDSVGFVTVLLRHLLDDLNQFIGAIPMMTGEVHQFTGSFEHGIPIGCAAGDGDTSATSKFDQPFIADGP